MSRRDPQMRRAEHGEHYARLSEQVLMCDAYHAIPPWAVRTLIALAAQYRGTRNGSLGLPWHEAQRLGVSQRWQLYGGLQILEAADLIVCTRRGHLAASGGVPSLYALSWLPITHPASGVIYDEGIRVQKTPTHAYARWVRPAGWKDHIRLIVDRARGVGGRRQARTHASKKFPSPTPEVRVVPTPEVRDPPENPSPVPPPEVREHAPLVPPPEDTSRVSGLGTTWALLLSWGYLLSVEEQTAAITWLLAATLSHSSEDETHAIR